MCRTPAGAVILAAAVGLGDARPAVRILVSQSPNYVPRGGRFLNRDCFNARDPRCMGGAATQAAIMRQEAAGADSAIRLMGMDGGKITLFHPSSWKINEFAAARLGVDATLIDSPFPLSGNGWDSIYGWLSTAQRPLVSTNHATESVYTVSADRHLTRGTIVEAGGIRFGVMSLWPADTFLPVVDSRIAAVATASGLRRDGADFVLAVCTGLASFWYPFTPASFAGLGADAVLPPHCVSESPADCVRLNTSELINNTWVLSDVRRGHEAIFGGAIAAIDLVREGGKLRPDGVRSIDIMVPLTASVQASPQYQADVQWLQAELDATSSNDPLIGYSNQPMPASRVTNGTVLVDEVCRRDNCSIGLFALETINKVLPGYDVYMWNGGAMREGWAEGPVRMSQIYGAMPFRNPMCTFNATGPELWAHFEKFAAGVASDGSFNESYPGLGGGFPQVWGLRWAMDPSRAAGERVLDIEIRDAATGEWATVRRTRHYSILTSQFLCDGGDGYEFQMLGRRELGLTLVPQDIMIERFQKAGLRGPSAGEPGIDIPVPVSVVHLNDARPTFVLARLEPGDCGGTQYYLPQWGDCAECPAGRIQHHLRPEECEWPAQSSDSKVWIWILVGVGALLLLVGPPVVWRLTSNWRRIRRLYSAHVIAASCAESIAAMRFDEVAYIKAIPNPDRIQRAFIDIINVLTQYRAYLPQAILVDSDEEAYPDKDEPSPEENPLAGQRSSGSFASAFDPTRTPPRHPVVASSPGKRADSASLRTPASSPKPDMRSRRMDPQQVTEGLLLGGWMQRANSTFVLASLELPQGDEKGGAGNDLAASFSATVLYAFERQGGVVVTVAQVQGGLQVLAGWNTSRRNVKHALNACCAVRVMRERMGPGCQKWSAAVAGGPVRTGNVGTEGIRQPVVLGAAVQQVSCLAALALQLRAQAIASEAVFQRVRSEMPMRVIDTAILPGTAGEASNVFEFVAVSPSGDFTEAYSELRACKYTDAASRLAALARMPGGSDNQTLRLLHVAAYWAMQKRIEPYCRTVNPSLWDDVEGRAAQATLPGPLQELVDTPAQARIAQPDAVQSVGESSPKSNGEDNEDDTTLLRRRLHDLMDNLTFSVPVSGGGKPDTDQSGVAGISSINTQHSRCRTLVDAQGAPPSFFEDARGRKYHRSQARLGKGAFGEVWLGMGDDAEMCAVKSLPINFKDDKTPTYSGHGSSSVGASTMVQPMLLGGDPADSLQRDPRDCSLTTQPTAGAGATLVMGNVEPEMNTQQLVPQIMDMVQEVGLMTKLQHDNVVQYLGCALEGRYILIVMEYVPGGSLEGLMSHFGGRLPAAPIARLVTDILRGLVYIHENSIVHRDLKPANVLVTADGQAKLADFGASAVLGKLSARVTATNSSTHPPGALAGTPLYMAPEQARNAACYASDVWALGIILCELYVGAVPWPPSMRGRSVHIFVATLASEESCVPVVPVAELPATALALVNLCFDRDPEKRPSAKELLSQPYFLC
eukprot:TRINITY_DN735_c0_g2_i5.p1 TRINITY_DN735_c0_g2~~TRINITY_DN735_c0_g2_i5.p1  ORF type:complete len:1549 (+),score=399.66 TRINITY_DN735_c0_g2_i5:148-4647(+)